MFLLQGTEALASGFQLKSIGSLNVDGVTYDHLWYSGGDAVFSGIGLAGTSVTATIDGTNSSITVDDQGNWSHTATLTDGDHSVSFVSDAGSVSFTLTTGPVPDGIGALTQSDTPTVGTITPTLIAVVTGSFLVIAGLFAGKRQFA